jgi:DNA-binding transcriptional ArsR family regulator
MPPDKKNPHPKTGRVPKLDERIAKALNHPLRTQILAVLGDTCASPSEIARLLDEDLSNVSYHTNVLSKLECVEMVDQEHVRGALKTRYRATTKMLLDTPDWERLSDGVKTGISVNAINEVMQRASAALEAGTFEKRPDRIIATLKMDVDEQGWQDATEAVRKAFDRLSEVEEETANRKAEGAKTFPITASLLSYQSPTKED